MRTLLRASTPPERLSERGGELLAEQAVRGLSAATLVAVFCIRVGLHGSRWFNPDEFEHLHAAWCVSHGGIPYSNFFEHHTPWFYWLLAPLASKAGESYDSAVAALGAARGVTLVLTAAALVALVWVGRVWTGLLCGLAASLLLAGMPMFLDKTIEVRPDVPVMGLWMCCLAFLVWGMRCGAGQRGRLWFFASALCLGGAIMFTQKMLFTLPGLGLGLGAWLVLGARRQTEGSARERGGGTARTVGSASPDRPGALFGRLAGIEKRQRAAALQTLRDPAAQGAIQPGVNSQKLRLLAWWSVGLVLPLVLTWAAFAFRGAGFAFIYNNFLLNAHWQAAEPPQPFLQRMSPPRPSQFPCACGSFRIDEPLDFLLAEMPAESRRCAGKLAQKWCETSGHPQWRRHFCGIKTLSGAGHRRRPSENL